MYIFAFKARILCSSEKQTPKIYREAKMYELMIVHKKQKKMNQNMQNFSCSYKPLPQD